MHSEFPKMAAIFRSFILLFFFISCASTPPHKQSGVTRILAIGDSITKGGTGPGKGHHKNNIQGGWVTRLGKMLPGQVEIINKGVDGETAKNLYKRMDKDAFSYEPDLLIIGIGTNEHWRGFGTAIAPPGTKDTLEFKEVMTKIFSGIKSRLPHTRVLVLGAYVPLQKYWHKTFWSFMLKLPPQNVLQDRFSSYNSVLASLSKQFGFSYVNIP